MFGDRTGSGSAVRAFHLRGRGLHTKTSQAMQAVPFHLVSAVMFGTFRFITSCFRTLMGDDSLVPLLRRKTVLSLSKPGVVSSTMPCPGLVRQLGVWRLGAAILLPGETLARFVGDACRAYAVARRGGLDCPPKAAVFPLPEGAPEIVYVVYDFSFMGRVVSVVVKRETCAAFGEVAQETGVDEYRDAFDAVARHGPPHLMATLWKTCFGAGIDVTEFFDRFGASACAARTTGLRMEDLVYVANALGACSPKLLASLLLATPKMPFLADVTSLTTGTTYTVRSREDVPLPAFD